MKLIIKLALAALLANAAWQIGSAYAGFYRFKDSVQQTVQFGRGRSEAELRRRIVDLASQFEVPMGEDDFTLRRDEYRTSVTGSFKQRIQLLPGYVYPWTFTLNVEAMTALQ